LPALRLATKTERALRTGCTAAASMPLDAEMMADVRRANRKSRWGGQLNPRPARAEHITTALNQHSLRKLDGHGGGKRVSLLGIGSRKRDAEQLQLESLFAEFQRLKIDKEKLERDDVPSLAESRAAPLSILSDHEWTKQPSSSGAVTWELAAEEELSPLRSMTIVEEERQERDGADGGGADQDVGQMAAAPAEAPVQFTDDGDFAELLRAHSMTPAQARPAALASVPRRAASVGLPAPALQPPVPKAPQGRARPADSVDRWLLDELALAQAPEPEPEPEPEPRPGADLLVGPMTQWLLSIGLKEFAARVLAVLPKRVVDTIDDAADCQIYFESLVKTKRGLEEARSLCKTCGMMAPQEAAFLVAVRAPATAMHTPIAPKGVDPVRNWDAEAPEPGKAAREAVMQRAAAAVDSLEVVAGTVAAAQGRAAMSATRHVGPGIARSNRAADLRARKSHSHRATSEAAVAHGRRAGSSARMRRHTGSSLPASSVSKSTTAAATADRVVASVKFGAPFSSVLLDQLSGGLGEAKPPHLSDSQRLGKVLEDVTEHSDLASAVLASGQRLLKQQERERGKEAERAAAEAATRKRILEQGYTDLQINI
jgi:hypothetical protein